MTANLCGAEANTAPPYVGRLLANLIPTPVIIELSKISSELMHNPKTFDCVGNIYLKCIC